MLKIDEQECERMKEFKYLGRRSNIEYTVHIVYIYNLFKTPAIFTYTYHIRLSELHVRNFSTMVFQSKIVTVTESQQINNDPSRTSVKYLYYGGCRMYINNDFKHSLPLLASHTSNRIKIL